MTLGEARQIAGSLGFPSKMPGTSYGLPASACIAGARLAKMPGTICSECYALGGRAGYQIPRAAKGLEYRLKAIVHPRWADAMVRLLTHSHTKQSIKVDCGMAGVRRQAAGGSRYQWNVTGFHRWHDSGDLQSVEHLRRIYEVCRRTPRIKHWLPTREIVMLREAGPPPPNLTIRVSAALIGAEIASEWPASMVHTDAPPEHAHECPAPKQEHKCGSCRACWSRDVRLVSYAKH